MLAVYNRYKTNKSTEVLFVTDSQSGLLILHLVNLTSAGTWRQSVDEYIPIGPVEIRVKLPDDVRGRSVQLLVSGQKISGNVEKGWVQFTVNSILDYEVVVVS